MVAYVIVPGIGGSDERHWQSRWEAGWGASATRIAPGSWTEPDLEDWVAAVRTAYERAARQADGDGVALVAHSLGCWAAARWLEEARPGGVVAFLAAPPDPLGPAFPHEAASTFLGVTARPLPCPGLVVSSDDDPYCGAAAAAGLATGWESPRTSVGKQGHINSDSGHGDWERGRELLRVLLARTPAV
ncbi:RBBP9/YdeN family alpha/beta hydrolase [Streptomyces sp. NPDC048590]|uniref:RBBP9/YdeN family alpha/beta hydrolase n=1 Tax=Streptomyces sp. NPDC048590 TaxID=3365574 RepID=UPI00371D2362